MYCSKILIRILYTKNTYRDDHFYIKNTNQTDSVLPVFVLQCFKTPEATQAPWKVVSLVGVRSGSKGYYKAKVNLLKTRLKELSKKPLTPEDIDELIPSKKYKRAPTKSVRVTQVHGLMEGK